MVVRRERSLAIDLRIWIRVHDSHERLVDQSIALITSIGACSRPSLLLDYSQIAEQREASYRPELVFSRTFLKAMPDQLGVALFPTRWVTS